MKLYKKDDSVFIVHGNEVFYKSGVCWDNIVNRKNLFQQLKEELVAYDVVKDNVEFLLQDKWDAPIGSQEIWASGVTYRRSREARMEESQLKEGADFYDLVYNAERPELFFKALAQRTVGNLGQVNIRKDSLWNVPEPELTLFISSEGTIEGYTVGNDMSSRSIEGENPLYLPQAKVYEGCASIGPCLYVPEFSLSHNTEIKIFITRSGKVIYSDCIAINQMKRSFDELVGYLYKSCEFPNGSFLMTGTGMVPGNDFTLEKQDEIRIHIDEIGTLVNYVGCI